MIGCQILNFSPPLPERGILSAWWKILKIDLQEHVEPNLSRGYKGGENVLNIFFLLPDDTMDIFLCCVPPYMMILCPKSVMGCKPKENWHCLGARNFQNPDHHILLMLY